MVVTVKNAVATIRFNQPKKLNAWSQQMMLEMRAAMQARADSPMCCRCLGATSARSTSPWVTVRMWVRATTLRRPLSLAPATTTAAASTSQPCVSRPRCHPGRCRCVATSPCAVGDEAYASNDTSQRDGGCKSGPLRCVRSVVGFS